MSSLHILPYEFRSKTDNSIKPGPDSGIGAGSSKPIPAAK